MDEVGTGTYNLEGNSINANWPGTPDTSHYVI
jgi:hypothetical protein